MFDSSNIVNLDLFSVGIAIASMAIIGFVVFFNNKKSTTNRAFLFLAVSAITWSIFNYLSYQFAASEAVLWLQRLVIFSAVWYTFALFYLFYVFPATTPQIQGKYRIFLIAAVTAVSILNLTPLVFYGVKEVASAGEVAVLDVRPGIALFGVTVLGLLISGIVILIKKLRKASGTERAQLRFILIGATITFLLHIVFNFTLPALFDRVRFIPFGAVFTFPFVAFTAYAIVRHHLLSVKVVATEILTFILAVVTLFEVVIARDVFTLVFRSGVFVLVLGFGILLIKSVLREVEQREELQRLNAVLEEQKLKLEDLSRFKTQLLSLASHQVKSPLAAIKGFASVLMDGLYGPVTDKVKETLKKIKLSADELIALINNLLDLRKVEEGKMEYQFAKTDLVPMIENIMETLQPLAAEKKLEFSFTHAGLAEAQVSADAQKLKQVVQNLVDNAIKYTPQGFVKVSLAENPSTGFPRDGSGQAGPTGGSFTVSVSDSGLGIPKELVPQLFEEFIRDERVKQKIRGTGLGLFIARKILEAHGGKISVESAGEGKGSTFRMTIPRSS